jgi:hypothetical protein
VKKSERFFHVGQILGSLDYVARGGDDSFASTIARSVVELAGFTIREANAARTAWYAATGSPAPEAESPFLEELAATLVRVFNARCPVGAVVRYYPVKGRASCKLTRTRGPAFVEPNGRYPVVFLEDVVGFVHLEHVALANSEDAAALARSLEVPRG